MLEEPNLWACHYLVVFTGIILYRLSPICKNAFMLLLGLKSKGTSQLQLENAPYTSLYIMVTRYINDYIIIGSIW